jgi:hypothetical protein
MIMVLLSDWVADMSNISGQNLGVIGINTEPWVFGTYVSSNTRAYMQYNFFLAQTVQVCS